MAALQVDRIGGSLACEAPECIQVNADLEPIAT